MIPSQPPGRRAILGSGALALAIPISGAAAQPAAPEAPDQSARREAAVFNLWVISDQHVGTDKAMSTAVLHGMVGFSPPPMHMESLAEALRQSEVGNNIGAPPIPWDIALNLGDYAGFWDAPEDEQGREVVRQYGALKQHRREQVYNIAGNHDPRRSAIPRARAKKPTGGFANGPTRWGSIPKPRSSTTPNGHIRPTAPGNATRSKWAIFGSL